MAQNQTMNGYSKLASLMGPHPELAIFRRFASLNAQNLLYLQAELVYLEHKLHQCVKSDAESGHIDRTIYDREWQSLSESVLTTDGNPEQWQTILKIRSTVKEYNEALLLQTILAKQDGPLSQDMTFLQHWMKRPSMGYVYLLGADGDVYEKPDASDLIVIKRHRGQSIATRIIGDFWARFWHRCLGRKHKTSTQGVYANTIHYSDQTFGRVGVLIGTMCASTLPVLAIVLLYCVQSMGRRLAAIAVFTSLFSAVLGIFSNGRGIEIFAATAAFAAVQVVFVGTTSGNNTATAIA